MRISAPIVALAALCLPATTACAQCPIPREIVTASRALSDAERAAISACVDSQAQAIATGSPSEVARARMEMTQPPRSPGASEVFRRAYSDAVRAKMREIIKNQDEFRAVNALTVLAFLLTVEGLDDLVENATPNEQPSETLRIASARLLAQASKTLAGSNPPYALNPAQSDSLARKLREAAMAETSWVALSEIASTLLTQSNWRIPPVNQETVRAELVRVLQRQVELSKTAPETMRAVHPTLAGIRKQIIEMPATAAPAYAQQLEPTLRTIKTLSANPPANASDSLKRVFEQCGSLVDQILGLLRR